MALHLLQTALRDGALSEDHLKRNLYAILNITDQFVDGYDLKAVADGLYGVGTVAQPANEKAVA